MVSDASPPLAMKTSFFDQITDPKNIRAAYLDLAKKFDEDSKTERYRGVDGLNIPDLDFTSEEVIREIRDEMLALRAIAPAYLATTPKKNGKKRSISIYPVKERVKAEAIFRVLFPFFDKYFSDFLFSYRSSHPSYYAARSAVRRYKRYYGQNHVLVTDFVNYGDSIDHDLLLEKIKTLGFDDKTVKLLELFIKTRVHENGKLITRPCGILSGTPLCALLSNFYLDAFDKWAGKRVAFYRRVGDDMIAMDKDATRIKELHASLLETVKTLKLQINQNKETLIKDTEPFKFLGYSFHHGLVGFDESSISKAKAKWKKELSRIPGLKKGLSQKTIAQKIRGFRNMDHRKTGSPDDDFGKIIQQKILVDDTRQIKKFSDSLAGKLATFLFGYDTPHKRQRAAHIIKDSKTRSLFEQYLFFRFRKK